MDTSALGDADFDTGTPEAGGTHALADSEFDTGAGPAGGGGWGHLAAQVPAGAARGVAGLIPGALDVAGAVAFPEHSAMAHNIKSWWQGTDEPHQETFTEKALKPLNKVLPEPQTQAERVAEFGGELLPGAVAGGWGGIGNAVRAGAGLVGGTLVGGVGQEIAPDNLRPLVGTAGAIIGGGAGELGAAGAAAATERGVAGLPGKLGKGAAENLAAKRIAKETENPAQVQADIAAHQAAGPKVPGEEPTTGEVITDKGLRVMQRDVAKAHEADFKERENANNAVRAQTVKNLQNTPGNPEDMANFFRSEIDAFDALSDQKLSRIGGQLGPQEYGRAMQTMLQAGKDATKAEASQLWSLVPTKSVHMATTPVTDPIREFYNRQSDVVQRNLSGPERNILGEINQFGKKSTVPLDDTVALRGLVNDALRTEMLSSGQSAAWGRLSQVRKIVNDAITQQAYNPALSQPVQQALQAATKATARSYELFDPWRKTLQRQGTSSPYKTRPTDVLGQVFPAGAKGADTVEQFMRSTRAGGQDPVPLLEDYAAATLRQASTKGGLTPKTFQAWQTKYQPALSKLPASSQAKFADVNSAFGTVAGAAGRATTLRDAYAKGTAASYLKLQDPADVTKTVGSLFKRSDGRMRYDQLRQLTDRDPSGNATQGLNRAVIDHIVQQYLTGNDEALRGAKFQEFLRNNRDLVHRALGPHAVDQLNRVSESVEAGQKLLRDQKLAGRTSTASDIKGLLEHGKDAAHKLTPMGFIVAALGAVHEGASPLTAGLGSAAALLGKHLYDRGLRRSNDVIKEAFLHPGKMNELLSRRAFRKGSDPWMQTLRRLGGFGVMAGNNSP